jgi:FkbM family methyltransferase
LGVLNSIKNILHHPLSKDCKLHNILRFVKWQIGSRLVPGPVIFEYVNDAKLLAKPGMTGATGNLYVGLHEFEDMAFLLHMLRPHDLFVDVGANVGSYTILAGAAVGARCLSFEPIPEVYKWLIDNINLNGIRERVEAKNMGLGQKNGVLHFTQTLDTTNHVATENEMLLENTLAVPVETLDRAIGNKNPVLI